MTRPGRRLFRPPSPRPRRELTPAEMFAWNEQLERQLATLRPDGQFVHLLTALTTTITLRDATGRTLYDGAADRDAMLAALRAHHARLDAVSRFHGT